MALGVITWGGIMAALQHADRALTQREICESLGIDWTHHQHRVRDVAEQVLAMVAAGRLVETGGLNGSPLRYSPSMTTVVALSETDRDLLRRIGGDDA